MEQAITKNNAELIKAKLIAEGGNGSTTFQADQILRDKNVLIIPDILCNAGGVTCSYLEWIKNIEFKRPGRLTEKWEEKAKRMLLGAIKEELLKTGVDLDISKIDDEAVKGASDLDLVYSGIENIMTIALNQTVQTA